MFAELFVSLLEADLENIKTNLGDNEWKEFIKELQRYSENLRPQMSDLENWAENVRKTLNKYPYTKGLLSGILFSVKRDIKSISDILKEEEQPEVKKSGRVLSNKSFEEDLLERIKELVRRAISL